VSPLAERLLAGDRRALARAITAVESGGPERVEILRGLHGQGGRAQVVGITGAPGAGKSTLVARLGVALRDAGEQVGILAVDPSSPFTGGALLGDRVRMGTGEGLFIRSLASRGHAGGLSRATADAVRLLDAAGFTVVLLETVGAGQGEVEIMRLAHTTVVVTVPGLGDDVQAFKAGIMEIGDIFVVNKCDLPGANLAARDLTTMLMLAPPRPWSPPVIQTSAVRGDGVDELVRAIADHARHLRAAGLWEARAAELARRRFEDAFAELALRRLRAAAEAGGSWQAAADAVARGELDPFAAAEQVLQGVGRSWSSTSATSSGP
jgi:LAO/AO transport system kinase